VTTVQLIAILAQTVGIVSTCWAIIAGIDAWKREFIGKRRIELAEEVLAAFFEIKDAMAMIRNPWSSGDEGTSRKKGEHETEVETELLNRGYIVFERYEAKKEVFQRFAILKYRFMASFGADTEDIFNSTTKTLNKVFLAARQLATYYWQRQGRVQMTDTEFKKHLDGMHKHEGVFWDMDSPEDEIRGDLKRIQERLDSVTKPAFEEKAKLYGFMTTQIGCFLKKRSTGRIGARTQHRR
jgi:hypothetical protein